MTSPTARGGGARRPALPQLQAAASTFALLSSPVRLHLVWLAANAPRDVGTLAREVGVTVASASQHLTKLRLAGVVTTRSVGRNHIYTVEDPHILTLVGQIFDHISPDGTLAPDPAPR
ncbi:DNA-binding transcriptional ArsR family regulator [Nakamurella sp. UYEF19]